MALPAATSISRVLIVRPSALGDVSRTVPALVTLRRALPGAQIDWLVQDTCADAIRHHPDLSGVILFPRRRFGALYNPAVLAEAVRWAGDLRHRRYDLVIDLQGLFRSGLFTWLTRAPRRVGFADAREFGHWGYTQRHPVDGVVHTVDRMLGLLAAEGYEPQHDMRLYVGPEDQRWLEGFLAEHGLTSEGYAVLAPTARWLTKCWPIERYAEIARRLLDDGRVGSKLVVLTSPAEAKQVQPLLKSLGPNPPVVLPRTTVGQMMALLSRTRLLVCNDSAPLHMAVGFDRPIVTLFGPTDPARVGPYHRPEAVIRPAQASIAVGYRHQRDDQSLIGQITVDQVWRKIEQELEEGEGQKSEVRS